MLQLTNLSMQPRHGKARCVVAVNPHFAATKPLLAASNALFTPQVELMKDNEVSQISDRQDVEADLAARNT
ncbi:hypothetical protein O9992_12715 [Vibrio lentus]|nr:hypothetical protein [Vibrio lentus]